MTKKKGNSETFYSAFDIETMNLKLISDEATKFFGEMSDIEIFSNLSNSNSFIEKETTRIVQIPVLIAYTHFSKFSYECRDKGDKEKCVLFEIASLKGDNTSIINSSLKMMQDFWLSLKDAIIKY